jgi:hypothetical protein
MKPKIKILSLDTVENDYRGYFCIGGGYGYIVFKGQNIFKLLKEEAISYINRKIYMERLFLFGK